MRAYLTDKSYSNGTLADFLGAIETRQRHGPRRLVAGWLLTADRDTLGSASTSAMASSSPAAGARDARRDRPTGRTRSTSRAGPTAARWPRDDDRHGGGGQPLDGLVGTPEPAVLVPNASDLTWARVRLVERTLAALPIQLGRVPDAQARAVVWCALIDGVHGAEVSPMTFLDVFESPGPWRATPRS